MREDLLHFIWNHKKLPIGKLRTTAGESIELVDSGRANTLAGPDFFNAKLRIGGQLWAGNVEIHIDSSDWYKHHHETDLNYDAVILHVVWNHDMEVFRTDGSEIPTLELKSIISNSLLLSYKTLMENGTKNFINCEKSIQKIETFQRDNWLERLYLERLEQKCLQIEALLEDSSNDWEKVLFILLLKAFGGNINGHLFQQIGESIDFSIIRKLASKPLEMESLLMGLSGLLRLDRPEDAYYTQLKRSYSFLKNKFGLEEILAGPPEFFKLRPLNFPTLRLAQIAAIYSNCTNVFQVLIGSPWSDRHTIFKVALHPYWNTHYNFGRESKLVKKRIAPTFLELILINTIVPVKFSYGKHKGLPMDYEVFEAMENTSPEKNTIIQKYKNIGVAVTNAKESQSLLQMHHNYCQLNKCMQCGIGMEILNLKS